MKPSIKAQAVLELCIAAVFWGFGFIATIWALKFLSPAAITFYRFFLAFVVSFAILFFRKTSKENLIKDLKLTALPGVFLWATLFSQTWGLEFTTATKSSFITTLYVIIVPVMMWGLKKEKLRWLHWVAVLIALFGTSLIINLHELKFSPETLNWGDFLTLLCAFAAAVSIISVGKRGSLASSPFSFNTFQCFWVGIIALLFFPWSSRWELSGLTSEAWLGLLSLGFGSSLLAFWLQVRAQRVLSPSVASLLFLMESPIACLFAFLLLNERMTSLQWVGAGFILIACGFTIIPQKK